MPFEMTHDCTLFLNGSCCWSLFLTARPPSWHRRSRSNLNIGHKVKLDSTSLWLILWPCQLVDLIWTCSQQIIVCVFHRSSRNLWWRRNPTERSRGAPRTSLVILTFSSLIYFFWLCRSMFVLPFSSHSFFPSGHSRDHDGSQLNFAPLT